MTAYIAVPAPDIYPEPPLLWVETYSGDWIATAEESGARRIAAALNAVEGIPTEQLEAGIVAIAMHNLKEPQP